MLSGDTRASSEVVRQSTGADVRRGYAGRVEVGEDLMQIEIGDEVVVRRAPVVARP